MFHRFALWFTLAALGGTGLFGRSASLSADTFDTAVNESVFGAPVGAGGKIILLATLCRPNGPGPFPLAIIIHGKKVGGNPRLAPRNREYYLTRYFVSRGYAVVLPMMRGFNTSGGVFPIQHCEFERSTLVMAGDIRDVIRLVSTRRFIDGTRVVVCGQSMGGWITLAVGSLNIPGVRGLVDFSGIYRVVTGFCGSFHLAGIAGRFGGATRVPSLWFYGKNDSLIPIPFWGDMYTSYVAAGGRADLVDVGVFEQNAHYFVGSVATLNTWVPKLDAFLARIGMPNYRVTPHKLRHSYASHLLARGADIRSIQELLGHADLSSTQIYTKVTNAALHETVRSKHPRG